jgi:hypothetical protein
MKKIINLLLVHRQETKDKWWHRLFVVILFGSGIFVFILTIYLTVVSYYPKWVVYGDKPLAYGAESNYQEVSGKELPCNLAVDELSNDNNHLSFIIQCNGVNLSYEDSKKYKTLYDSVDTYLQQQFGLVDKYSNNCPSAKLKPAGTPFTNEQLACIRQSMAQEQADPDYIKYQTALDKINVIKVSENSNLWHIIFDIALWIIIPIFVFIVWILFWDSIIYRAVLYIIFGKKK